MIDQINIDDLIDGLLSAGQIIMDYYHRQAVQVELKADQSPVTEADQASNNYLINLLTRLHPDVPIISEETEKVPYSIRKKWAYCWLVDPLDGTKEFLKKNGEFSINLALIHDDKPVVGLVHFPVQQWTYYAVKGKGMYKKTKFSDFSFQSSASKKESIGNNTDNLVMGKSGDIKKPSLEVMISRSHSGDREYAFIELLEQKGYCVNTHPHGSAMKHCLVAEGVGDIYPKFGSCSEWDTAPGQLIIEEAGGATTRVNDWLPLQYNKASFENPEFIMWGGQVHEKTRDLLISYINP